MSGYEEVMNALAFYFGDGVYTPSEDSIREVISQEYDVIETIGNALDDYRASQH